MADNSDVLSIEPRDDVGKGASRRLRHKGLVPGIIYGGQEAPLNFVVPHKVLIKLLENESFYTQIINIQVNGNKQQVLLKDLQRHAYKPQILHLDFQRITGKETLRRHVPIHFINEDTAIGVKQGGGTVFHQMKDIEVICSANDLPEYIEVDLANVALNETLHLSDLVLPKGVKIAALELSDDHNLSVVTIQLPRRAAEGDAEEASAEGEETPQDGANASKDE